MKKLLHSRVVIIWISILVIGGLFTLYKIFFKRYDQTWETKSIIGGEKESLFYKSHSGPSGSFPPFSRVKFESDKREVTFDDFVGSEVCGQCHSEQYQLWQQSTHGKAGGKPNPDNVMGKFNSTPIYFKDAVVIPSINENHDYIFTIKREGMEPKILKVDYVVGGGHMFGGGTQATFSIFPDGTIKFLPFDFIKKEDIWFVQLRKDETWTPISRDLSLSDLAHWPPYRILGIESHYSNCQNCHGSQIIVTQDPQNGRYHTKFKSLKINCESCHGPGKKHVEIATVGDIEDSLNIGMISLSTLSKDLSLQVCFQCHAVKDVLKDDYLPGKEFNAYFSLKLPILGNNPYLPDGRVRSFAYQQNHLFSDCYLSGSMVCVDCHSPHSLKYRDINRNPLNGKFDNGQCLGCHASKADSPELHSHHLPDSPGNLCTSCHMPFLQHQGIGNQLKFTRSDHTIPIPRPEFDEKIGIENACQKCHSDQSISWLQTKTDEWYGELKPHNIWIRGLLESQKIKDREVASRWLLNLPSSHSIAMVTNLFYFVTHFLDPDMEFLEPQIKEWLREMTYDEDIDLKSFALMSLHFCCDVDSSIHRFLQSRIDSLGREEIPVRTRWGIAMDDLGSLYEAKGNMIAAISLHKKATDINPTDYIAWVNLGNAYKKNREVYKAIISYKKALEFEWNNASIHFLLAEAYIINNQMNLAVKSLREGLKYDPDNSSAKKMLRRLKFKKNNHS